MYWPHGKPIWTKVLLLRLKFVTKSFLKDKTQKVHIEGLAKGMNVTLANV